MPPEARSPRSAASVEMTDIEGSLIVDEPPATASVRPPSTAAAAGRGGPTSVAAAATAAGAQREQHPAGQDRWRRLTHVLTLHPFARHGEAAAGPPEGAPEAPPPLPPPTILLDDIGHERLAVDLSLLRVRIASVERGLPGLARPGRAMYTLAFDYYGMRWTVPRRYREFLRLHTRLRVALLQPHLPPFPYFLRRSGGGTMVDTQTPADRSMTTLTDASTEEQADQPTMAAAIAAVAAGTAVPMGMATGAAGGGTEGATAGRAVGRDVPHPDIDGNAVFQWHKGLLEQYLIALLKTPLSPAARVGAIAARPTLQEKCLTTMLGAVARRSHQNAVIEFCQCSDASFMRDMGPKPYETRIAKRPGGRHFER